MKTTIIQKKLEKSIAKLSVYLMLLISLTSVCDVNAQDFCELRYDGILVPQIDRNTVSSPEKGLTVFDINTNTLWFHNGTDWVENAGENSPWNTVGDNIYYNDGNVGVIGSAYNDISENSSFEVIHSESSGGLLFTTNYNLNHDGRSIQASSSPLLINYSPSSLGLNPLGGNVGIGTKNPQELLDLNFSGRAGIKLTGDDSGDALIHFSNGGGNHFIFDDQSAGNTFDIESANDLVFNTGGAIERMRIKNDGNVGIGTAYPCTKLEIVGGSDATLLDGSGYLQIGSQSGTNVIMDNNEIMARNNEANSTLYLNNDGGLVRVGEDLSAKCVSIRGGCDITEGVNTISDLLEPGDVVVIDEKNPGNVRKTSEAYDKKVAGIISGANGINAGMQLSQQGVLEGDYPLAMIGQVYVKVKGKVNAGDMLTTSNIPGYAKAVKDYSLSPGAVIGKAMSSNQKGEEMVLVLVNLQ